MPRSLSLAEFWYLAEHVTGINAATLIKASRVELADSALHVPLAGFGEPARLVLAASGRRARRRTTGATSIVFTFVRRPVRVADGRP